MTVADRRAVPKSPPRNAARWQGWFRTVALLAFVFLFLTPLLFAVMVAFKTPEEQAANPIGLPGALQLDNFALVIGQLNYWRLVLNTASVTLLSSVLTLLVASLAAFPLARVQARWTEWVYNLFILGLTLPFFVLLIPLYILSRDLGLLNTLWGAALVYSGIMMPFAVFFLTGFVRSLPIELEEASAIDGCTPLGTFRYVILPLLRPANGTLAMFVALTVWNDLILSLLFFTRPESGTLTPALYGFLGQWTTDYTLLLAAALLASAPLLVFFFALQRQIIEGVAAGAVKG